MPPMKKLILFSPISSTPSSKITIWVSNEVISIHRRISAMSTPWSTLTQLVNTSSQLACAAEDHSRVMPSTPAWRKQTTPKWKRKSRPPWKTSKVNLKESTTHWLEWPRMFNSAWSMITSCSKKGTDSCKLPMRAGSGQLGAVFTTITIKRSWFGWTKRITWE